METFLRYNSEVQDYLSKESFTEFSILAALEGESLMIPEVFEETKSSTGDKISMGLTNVALYIGHSENPHTIQRQVKSLYEGLDVNYEFFNSMPLAINWLNSLNIKIDQEIAEKLIN